MMNFSKKCKGIILMTVLMAALGTYSAYAAAKKTSDYGVTIKKETFVNCEHLTVDVYKSGKSADDLVPGDYETNKNIIFYHDEIMVNSDEGFVFFMDGPTGDYDIYYGGENAPAMDTFYFVSKEDYDKLIKRIRELIEDEEKTEEDKEKEFVKLINDNDNFRNLTFDEYVNEKTDVDNAATLLFGHLCKNPLTDDLEDKSKTLISYWERCVAIDGVFTGYITDIVDNKIVLGISETKAAKFFDEKFVKNGKDLKKALTDYVVSKNADSIEKFEADVNDGFILAVANYPDGAANLQKVLKEYAGDIELDTGVITLENCRKVMNKSYDSIKLLKDAVYAPSEDGDDKKPASGGGGVGGFYNGSSVTEIKDETKPDEPVQNTGVFNDIANVQWAKEAIEGLYAQGIISGRGNGAFAPNDYVTREEIVKMLIEAFYKDYNPQGSCDYTDVNKNAWYYDYIVKATDKKIVTGYSDEVFGIGDYITREDFCVMVHRIINAEFGNNISFNDNSQISGYAVEAVNALYNMGIINGVGNNEFAPKSNATRAQAAKIIYMALNSGMEVDD